MCKDASKLRTRSAKVITYLTRNAKLDDFVPERYSSVVSVPQDLWKIVHEYLCGRPFAVRHFPSVSSSSIKRDVRTRYGKWTPAQIVATWETHIIVGFEIVVCEKRWFEAKLLLMPWDRCYVATYQTFSRPIVLNCTHCPPCEIDTKVKVWRPRIRKAPAGWHEGTIELRQDQQVMVRYREKKIRPRERWFHLMQEDIYDLASGRYFSCCVCNGT